MFVPNRIVAVWVASLMAVSSLPMALTETGRVTPEEVSRVSSASDESPFRIPSAGFTANVGQVANEDVRYYLAAGGVQVGFVESGVLIKLTEPRSPGGDREREHPFGVGPGKEVPRRGVLVRVDFEGSNAVMPEGRGEVAHRSNYFLGNDPTQWRTGVRSVREVVFPNLYNGIDLVYRVTEEKQTGEAGGLAKYEFLVYPGADPRSIVVAYEGIERLNIDENGDIEASTVLGSLHDTAPVAFQDGRPVACTFALRARYSYGFECEAWDRSRPLRIDPLFYSSFLGGNGLDQGLSVATDSLGNAYVTGATASTDFPTTPGAYDTTPLIAPDTDVFVTVLKPDPLGPTPDPSDLLYSTYIGGLNGWEVGHAIAVDSSGNAFVTGVTVSDDFPVKNGAYDTVFNGNIDIFVLKLAPLGGGDADLVYSTFLGGDQADYAGCCSSIAVDSAGHIYVVGSTFSGNFPISSGAYDNLLQDGDAVVVRLNPDPDDPPGSPDPNDPDDLIYSSFLGRGGNDWGLGVALDSTGNVFITGETFSSNFPTSLNPMDGSLDGGSDAFLTKLRPDPGGLTPDPGDLLYSTYVGGNGGDFGQAVALDGAGNAYLTGGTSSTGAFPLTPGAYDTTPPAVPPDTGDAFVVKISPSGSGSADLLYGTYLGGEAPDRGNGIVVSAANRVNVTGTTASANFPTTPLTRDTTLSGPRDAFVSYLRLFGTGERDLAYSTYLGGDSEEDGYDLALSPVRPLVYVTGDTNSINFPTTMGAYDVQLVIGTFDAFLTVECAATDVSLCA